MFNKRVDQKDTCLPRYNRLNRNIKYFKVKNKKKGPPLAQSTTYNSDVYSPHNHKARAYYNGDFYLKGV